MIRNQFFLLVTVGLLYTVVCTGCRSNMSVIIPPYQPLSVQQRAAMQTKETEGGFDTAFAGTISVLQDEGWQIEVLDRSSGIIQASSLKRQANIGPVQDWYIKQDPEYLKKTTELAKKQGVRQLEWTRWEQITAHIESWGMNTVRIRITITKFGSLPSNTFTIIKTNPPETTTIGAKQQSVVVENPATYQYLFQQIQRAIFIRQWLTSSQ